MNNWLWFHISYMCACPRVAINIVQSYPPSHSFRLKSKGISRVCVERSRRPRSNASFTCLHQSQLFRGGFHGNTARLDEVIIVLRRGLKETTHHEDEVVGLCGKIPYFYKHVLNPPCSRSTQNSCPSSLRLFKQNKKTKRK